MYVRFKVYVCVGVCACVCVLRVCGVFPKGFVQVLSHGFPDRVFPLLPVEEYLKVRYIQLFQLFGRGVVQRRLSVVHTYTHIHFKSNIHIYTPTSNTHFSSVYIHIPTRAYLSLDLGPPPYETRWFKQTLDHFNFDTRPLTWKQRYLLSDRFWTGSYAGKWWVFKRDVFVACMVEWWNGGREFHRTGVREKRAPLYVLSLKISVCGWTLRRLACLVTALKSNKYIHAYIQVIVRDLSSSTQEMSPR